MTTSSHSEVVGILTRRADFDAALAALQKAGFAREGLSVLASHESLDAADPAAQSWRNGLPALLCELRYQGPLLTAGFIALAAQPVGALLSSLIGAGIGSVAAVELMSELTARPHHTAFAEALKSGALLLWVAVDGPDQEDAAKAALSHAGALNVHVHHRAALTE